MFHKVLKSGCRAEEARLRTAERLVKLIAVFIPDRMLQLRAREAGFLARRTAALR